MARIDLTNINWYIEDGFNGTGAINDASISATDTVLGVDTLSLHDSVTIVPVGARFTTAGILTIRTVSAQNNSQQWTCTITGSPTGGTFTLTLNSETTAGIAYNAAASAVQSALEALASVTAGDVTVSGSAGGPYTITAAANLANISTNTLTADGSGLTGGSTPDAVIAVVQDGLSTWEMTFTPAIAAGSVPADDDVITFLPQRVLAPIAQGAGNWTENNAPITDLSRNALSGRRSGEEQVTEINFAFEFDFLVPSSGQPITIYEAIHQIGNASGWHTAASDPCEPYSFDIRLEDVRDCGSEQAQVILFPDCTYTSINPDIDDGQVNLTLESLATRPTITRVAKNTLESQQ